MSSLLEATRSLVQVFNGKLQEFNKEIDDVHMVWLQEIQQEAKRMFSSDFSMEPELMPKTPSQKKTRRRKRVSTEFSEARSRRRFSKGRRSNIRRSSVQVTLDSISELVDTQVPSNSTDSVAEEPVRRTRCNKATAATAVDSEPVKRSTRIKTSAKAKETVEEELAAAPQSLEIEKGSSKLERKEESISLSDVQVPTEGHLLGPSPAEKFLQASQSCSAPPLPISASGGQASMPSSSRHSLVVRRSLADLRNSMTKEAVRRASRRSFLRKKARRGDSTCRRSISGDVSVNAEPNDNDEVVEDCLREVVTMETPAAVSNAETEPTQAEVLNQPEPMEPEEKTVPTLGVEKMDTFPSVQENCRFTRSMARLSESDTALSSLSNDDGKNTQDAGTSRTASKRAAAEAAMDAICTPKKKQLPPKCLTGVTPGMRSFLHTVQKNQLLMMTPSSLGRTSVMKSFIKQSGKLDVKLSTGSVERERLKWDALNKKIEQENERKKKLEEERRKKQEELKKKRDERLRRVVEARVKVEKEKEQEKKKKIEEKMAQMEKKNDLLRVERLAEEKAKKKVASKRQEELETRRKQEAARKEKLQAEEEERRHLELLAKRKAEEEREKARKQAEAARALELKEQEKEREREQEKQRVERERERQAAAERERLERERVEQEKAIALKKELEQAAREKERQVLEEKRRKEEKQKKAEEERLAKQKHAAVTTTVVSKALNATITRSPALNVTVDIEKSAMKTPVGKDTAHNKTVEKGQGLNVTVDIEQSPQSYKITPKGKKVTALVNPEDYGMDQKSDDSTDDESAPRKPIPSWAEGMQLQQAIMKQYYDPLDLHSYFGDVEQPKLEKIFQMSKPRFFKRTSSAVWHSPPHMGAMPN